jgi:polyvinyl alcohol dehydrogenase (cytochrome)
MARSIGFFFPALVFSAAWLTAAPPDGSALFENNCALCHKTGADNRTPLPEALKRLPNRAIMAALESGSMKVQGSKLSIAERQAIADFLSPPTESSIQPLKLNACAAPPPALANLNGWNGWSTDLINSRNQRQRCSQAQGEMGLWIRRRHHCL